MTEEDLESRASKLRILRRPRPSALPYSPVNSSLGAAQSERCKRSQREGFRDRTNWINTSIEVQSALSSKDTKKQFGHLELKEDN